MNIGLNLFSVKSLIQEEDAFVDTLEKIKAMGANCIQCSGVEFNADLFAKVSEKTGLPIVLTHVPADRIINEPEKLMEEHSRFGCKNIGLGMMPREAFLSKEACYGMVDKLEHSAKIMSDKGYKFFYHNHHYEFAQFDGNTIMDYIIEMAPHINFTVDTYWVQYGGHAILEFLERVKGRCECIHLKDYRVYQDNPGVTEPFTFTPHFTHLGGGILNFPAIVEKMKEVGVKYFLIEQDDAWKYEKPLDEIAMSFKYVKENLL